MAEKGPFGKLWEVVGHVGNIQTLIGLASGSGLAAYVVSVLPGGWHPPQYWLVAGTTFFGTWLAVALVARAFEWINKREREIHNTPQFNVEHYDGENFSIVIRNVGNVKLAYLATGQLLETSEVPIKRKRPFTLTIPHGREFKPHETTVAVIAESYGKYSPNEVSIRGDMGTSGVVDRWPLSGLDSVDRKTIIVRVIVRSEPQSSEPFQRDYRVKTVDKGKTFQVS